jgi:hypothetical protein
MRRQCLLHGVNAPSTALALCIAWLQDGGARRELTGPERTRLNHSMQSEVGLAMRGARVA